MPVMGPNYSNEQADKAYNEIQQYLVSKYKLQTDKPISQYGNFAAERIVRNETLKKAVHALFELQSWEDF